MSTAVGPAAARRKVGSHSVRHPAHSAPATRCWPHTHLRRIHSGGPALADLLYFPSEKVAIVVLLNQQRLSPYIALGIADLVLPPGQLPPAIAESDPALTARHRALLTAAAQGKANTDEIAESARPALVRTLEEMGPIVIGVLDPVSRLELVEERKDAGRWTRKYRVMFGRAVRYWRFELAPDGKIVGLQPTSE